jgi:hypothetical protein
MGWRECVRLESGFGSIMEKRSEMEKRPWNCRIASFHIFEAQNTFAGFASYLL